MLTHHHPARAQHETPIGENIPFEEVVKRIRDKIDQRTSKASDRFRQAFKIFKKASGISCDEFHEGLLQLGFRLTDAQNLELFNKFDVNQSGDLDLNEFVQGISLDDSSMKYINAHIERQKKEEARRKRYQMAVESVEQTWTIEDMERKLREKIEQHTSKSSDCYRQAFKIFKKSCGIKANEFHDALADLGLDLNRSHTDRLFSKYDIDGSGDIDLPEFVRGVLPADYLGGTWVAEADEIHRIEMEKKKLKPDSHLNRIEIPNWTLDTIQMKVREKITQKTTKSSDTFRQVYKIFQKSNGITIDEFRQGFLILGFRLNDNQVHGLFNRYDTDHNGTIDLTEFCRHVLPPDYNGDGDHWGHTTEEHIQKHKDAIEYAKLTKNGTQPIPTPPLVRPMSAPIHRPDTLKGNIKKDQIVHNIIKEENDTRSISARPASARPVSARPASARPASARPASARPESARLASGRSTTPRPMSARTRISNTERIMPGELIRPDSGCSCSSSSSVAIVENPFKSKRKHFFHHHSTWRRKLQMLRQQNEMKQENPQNNIENEEDIIQDDDEDDEEDEEDVKYQQLRPSSNTRPASARPASAKLNQTVTARPPSAQHSRPHTAASTISNKSQSPRQRRTSDTSSQCSSRNSSHDGNVNRAKFKPRIYGTGFKKMFLQMAKEKLLQETS